MHMSIWIQIYPYYMLKKGGPMSAEHHGMENLEHESKVGQVSRQEGGQG